MGGYTIQYSMYAHYSFLSLTTRTQIFAFQFATELLFISLAPFGWQFFLILALKIALNVLAKGRLLEKLNLRLDHWLEWERVYRWPYAFQYGFKMNEWIDGVYSLWSFVFWVC